MAQDAPPEILGPTRRRGIHLLDIIARDSVPSCLLFSAAEIVQASTLRSTLSDGACHLGTDDVSEANGPRQSGTDHLSKTKQVT